MRCARAGLVLAVMLPAGAARANGAFPDSQAVLTPEDRPHEILLSTNFGLVTSADGGNSWTWSCEQDPNGARNLYQLGPPPRHRLFARDLGGLVFTDDLGCTWTAATGDLAGAVISDAFPDPSNADRVLAVAAPLGGAGGSYRVLESSDGGTTFSRVLYTAPAGATVSGVEIAHSDPRVVYLVVLKGADFEPALAVSTDAGITWQEHDLSAELGPGSVLLIAVDRNDSQRVYLQVNGTTSNTLAVVDGGGAAVTTPLHLEGGFMSGFLQTAGGAILLSGLVGADAVLYRSRDGARSFEPLPAPPKLWRLSERAGTIYGAARIGSPFAIATSSDEGETWQPFLRLADVASIAACVEAVCEDKCLSLAAIQLWSAQTCSPPGIPDAAADVPDAAPAFDAGPAPDAGMPDLGSPTGANRPSGCRCAVCERQGPSLPLLLLVPLLRSRHRRSRRRMGQMSSNREGASV